MSDDKEIKSNGDETQPVGTSNTTEEALLDTESAEYLIKYNLYYTGEYIGDTFLPTGHANLTIIERDGANDTVLGGGNIGVNLAGPDTVDSDGQPAERTAYSHVNPFSNNLDGIVGVDSAYWQGQGQAVYEQSITPEQLKDVQEHITDLTGGLETGLTNYNVSASVLSLDDQHSCYSFTQDVFEIAGGEGRLIDQFSEEELDKIKDFDGNPAEILIETVHGDIPKIPERAVEKVKDVAKDAADAVSEGVDSRLEDVREKTGLGSSDEVELSPEAVPTAGPIEEASLSTEKEISLYDAVETLSRDYANIENAYEGGPKTPVHQALDHPSAPAMFENLNNHDIESIIADISAELSPEDRASNILLGAQSATLEAGLSMPEEQHDLNAQANSSLLPSASQMESLYEDDYSSGL